MASASGGLAGRAQPCAHSGPRRSPAGAQDEPTGTPAALLWEDRHSATTAVWGDGRAPAGDACFAPGHGPCVGSLLKRKRPTRKSRLATEGEHGLRIAIFRDQTIMQRSVNLSRGGGIARDPQHFVESSRADHQRLTTTTLESCGFPQSGEPKESERNSTERKIGRESSKELPSGPVSVIAKQMDVHGRAHRLAGPGLSARATRFQPPPLAISGLSRPTYVFSLCPPWSAVLGLSSREPVFPTCVLSIS
jgi:hypothetical protein